MNSIDEIKLLLHRNRLRLAQELKQSKEAVYLIKKATPNVKLPEELIVQDTLVLGYDGRKMSKSYGNTIPLFEASSKLRKSIMKIKTNSQEPGEAKEPEGNTVFEIYRAFVQGATKDDGLDTLTLDAGQRLDVSQAGHTARGVNRNDQLASQFDGGLDVDAGEHAITADVGIDDCLDAVVFEFFGEIENIMAGHLAPAISGHLAVARIESDNYLTDKGTTGVT